MDSQEQDAELLVRVRAWVDEAVVGMDLCPFAGPVVRADLVRYVVASTRTLEDAVRVGLKESAHLADTPPDEVITTLICFRTGLEDFQDLLDAAGGLQDTLEEAGAGETIQVASFHPDWRFAGSDGDDPADYAGRGPCPILHLLRADDLEEAVAKHPDPDGIPERNAELLRALGATEVAARWSRW